MSINTDAFWNIQTLPNPHALVSLHRYQTKRCERVQAPGKQLNPQEA